MVIDKLYDYMIFLKSSLVLRIALKAVKESLRGKVTVIHFYGKLLHAKNYAYLVQFKEAFNQKTVSSLFASSYRAVPCRSSP